MPPGGFLMALSAFETERIAFAFFHGNLLLLSAAAQRDRSVRCGPNASAHLGLVPFQGDLMSAVGAHMFHPAGFPIPGNGGQQPQDSAVALHQHFGHGRGEAGVAVSS